MLIQVWLCDSSLGVVVGWDAVTARWWESLLGGPPLTARWESVGPCDGSCWESLLGGALCSNTYFGMESFLVLGASLSMAGAAGVTALLAAITGN